MRFEETKQEVGLQIIQERGNVEFAEMRSGEPVRHQRWTPCHESSHLPRRPPGRKLLYIRLYFPSRRKITSIRVLILQTCQRCCVRQAEFIVHDHSGSWRDFAHTTTPSRSGRRCRGGGMIVSNMEVMDGFGEVTIGCNLGDLSVVIFVANRGWGR